MLNNRSKDNSIACEMAEQQLLSVLYNEADPIEEQEFTSHLSSCKVCQAELAEFGEIRNTFSILRENELANLKLPEIIVPSVEQDFSAMRPATNWVTKLLGLFLFPKMQWQSMAATTAFIVGATLLLAIGLANLDRTKFDSTSQNNDLAATEFSQPSNLSVPNKTRIAESTLNESDSVQSKDNLTVQKITTGSNKLAVSNDKPADSQSIRRRKTAIVKMKSVRSKSLPTEIALPRLEEDENSLRLSDLLEEVGSVE